MPKRKKPVTLAFLTCEQVIIDEDGFVENLEGLVQGRVADELPFILPSLWVYWEVVGLVLGHHAYYVTITDENGVEVATAREWAIESAGDYETISKCAKFQRLTFPTHGIYRIRVVCGEKTVAERRFVIASPEEDDGDEPR